MKIVVIDNFDSFVYNIIRYLKEANNEIFVMRNNEIDLNVIENCDAIVLSPGPGIPNECVGMMKVIEQFHLSKPILGICLGHQALAEFFGNTLIQNEFPIHGEASELEILVADEIYEEINKKTQVGRYHSWSVKSPIQAPLICTAITGKDEIMSFKHEKLPLFGFQFHPESILTPDGRKMLNNWIKTISK
jgi:anthranilate synthase component II